MSDKPSRARISEAAILVRNAGFPDVCAWMMARDKVQSHTTRGRKRNAEVTREGRKVKGGKTKQINWDNDQIKYIDNGKPLVMKKHW